MLQHIGSLGVTHRCRGLCARVGSARPGIIVLASLLALACVLIDRASVNCSARIARYRALVMIPISCSNPRGARRNHSPVWCSSWAARVTAGLME